MIESLARQGFTFLPNGRLHRSTELTKADTRSLHAEAVGYRIEKARPGLQRHETRLLRYFAAGKDVLPEEIRPRMVEVRAGSVDELIFRYVRLHWSIPVSAGYGRRIRFVVYDDNNGKVVGIIGLGDPVFRLRARDRWIGWNDVKRREKLACVLDAFVLGAIPPYSQLLCGKLMALLTTSAEVRSVFKRKYGGRTSRIAGRRTDGRLALVTTTSALGRSSIYNRLRFRSEAGLIAAGVTNGSGEFHFSNALYGDLRRYAEANCKASGKNAKWGNGFRNRRELVRKVLPLLGLSAELVYHGVQREVYVAPLAANSAAFLRGECNRVAWFNRSAASVFDWFRERWMLPRAERDDSFKDFDPASLRIWEPRDA